MSGRPTRGEIERAALGLIARHRAQVLATARRYSATPEDAEDAYQRGLEILLTKAPTTSEDELLPWLKTVVKHEAFAVRRQRDRAAPTTDRGELAGGAATDTAADEQAERYERLRVGAEALKRLKPQEIRCLRLRAEGYSYKEICRITGWTYTKVNRCLTEGRRAFLDRVAGIEAGAECQRLAPLLSRLVDGEAAAEEVQRLRPHLRTCLACRRRLRAYREAPARVAALVPLAALGELEPQGGVLRGLVESALGFAQQKTAAAGERVHAAAELAAGQKIAAAAASAAALGGGGAAVKELSPGEPRAKHPRAPERRVVKQTGPLTQAPPPRPLPVRSPEPPPSAVVREAPAPQARAAPPAPRQQGPPPEPAGEFAPGAGAASPRETSSSDGGGFEPGGGAGGGGSGGGGEFGP